MKEYGLTLILALVILIVLPVSSSAKTIMDYIRSDARLREARSVLEEAGMLESIDPSRFGSELTIILPSNEALDDFFSSYPRARENLVRKKKNVETLILFASSDSVATPSSIRSGDYASEPLLSLLSESATIGPDGQVCVTDYTRSAPCDDSDSLPCCAYIDLDNYIRADDGYIYLVDTVVMPQEIADETLA